MKTSAEYLDELRFELGLKSDYAIAKLLDTSTARISSYRLGKTRFDDPTAVWVAEKLGISPFVVIAHMRAERAKDAAERTLWERLAEKAMGIAPSLAGAAITAGSILAMLQTPDSYGVAAVGFVYYVKSRRTNAPLSRRNCASWVSRSSPCRPSCMRRWPKPNASPAAAASTSSRGWMAKADARTIPNRPGPDGAGHGGMKYAAKTEVNSERSRNEIERTLARYGAHSFMYGTSPRQAVIAFEMRDRRIRFDLPMPDMSSKEIARTETGKARVPEARKRAYEQAVRQRWR